MFAFILIRYAEEIYSVRRIRKKRHVVAMKDFEATITVSVTRPTALYKTILVDQYSYQFLTTAC